MSKLFSCFWKSKGSKDSCDVSSQKTARSRRLSKENNEVIYVETGAFVERGAGNIKNVYRTETISQTPQYEKMFISDGNRQSRSYPVSPERRSLYKVYSFEQRPSFEKYRLSKVSRKDSRDSKNLKVYAANVNAIVPQFGKTSDDSFPFEIPTGSVPRRSTLSHSVDYEKELLVSKESPRCVAEKPVEEHYQPGSPIDKPVSLPPGIDKDKNILENERLSILRRSKVNNENCSPRSSIMGSQNLVYIATDNMTTGPKIKTVVRAKPQSLKNFELGSSVKQMVYRADDVYHSPMSAGKHVHQIPVKANKQPPLLTTPDGKILKPLMSNNVRRLSSSLRPLEPVEGFPLAHGGEVLVAAPMIGGGARRGGKAQKTKSILRKGGGRGGGGGAGRGYRGAPQAVDDYDDYPYEADYGRGGYYDDASDTYPFAPVEDYSYGQRGGYYDDGYGYADEDMGRYPQGPGYARGGRPPRQQVYAAQMPEVTLPGTSVDKGKNPPFKKMSKPLDPPEKCVDIDHYGLKKEKSNNKEEFSKVHQVKMISSAQQTDLGNELDFICFSPDRCFKATEAPDNPNSKLRWRIIIKRGDEE